MNTHTCTTQVNIHTCTTQVNTHTCTTQVNTHTCTTQVNTHTCTTQVNTHTCTTQVNTHTCTTQVNTHTCTAQVNTHTCTYLYLPLDRTGYIATIQEVSQQEITRLVDSVSRYNNNHRYRRYRSQTIIVLQTPRYPVTGEMMQYYLIAITSSVVLERTETHRSTCYSFAPSVVSIARVWK